MIIDEHSVPLPADKLWPPFAASVDRVTREWDVRFLKDWLFLVVTSLDFVCTGFEKSCRRRMGGV